MRESLENARKSDVMDELETLTWTPLQHLAAAQLAIRSGLLERALEHIARASEKIIGDHT